MQIEEALEDAIAENKARSAPVLPDRFLRGLGDAQLLTVASDCLLYTSPSPRDATLSRMPSSA